MTLNAGMPTRAARCSRNDSSSGRTRVSPANGALIALLVLGCSGCTGYPAWLATSGPLRAKVERSADEQAAGAAIRIVDIDAAVAQRVTDSQQQEFFPSAPESAQANAGMLGPGDGLEIVLWEAPPATLFGAASTTTVGTATGASVQLPAQVVDSRGEISVPFAGAIMAAGKTARQLEVDIAQRLRGKANQPQAFVKVADNASSAVTVVGEVNASGRMPLTSRGERLLDVLAKANGVRAPVDKITIQVTRGDQVRSLPLDTIIREPARNITLAPGDVVTALHAPLSFTVLGAAGRNEEVNFEAKGISLAQALGRSGGVLDTRADARGVFIFRFESPTAISDAGGPRTADGRVPVVYRANLKDPATFFVAQRFPVRDKDLIFVSNASAAELQKFLNVIMSAVYPIVNLNDTFNP